MEKSDAQLLQEAKDAEQAYEAAKQAYDDRFKPRDLGNGLTLEFYEATPGVMQTRVVKKEN